MGFNNEQYLKEQTAAILERVRMFKDKLYLEFGGKLLFDYHASRVLPGFDHNVKLRLLQQLKDRADILLCIYAGDIEKKKIRIAAPPVRPRSNNRGPLTNFSVILPKSVTGLHGEQRRQIQDTGDPAQL